MTFWTKFTAWLSGWPESTMEGKKIKKDDELFAQEEAKESAKAAGIAKYFVKEGGKYIPHGLKSEAGKVFPGQPKDFPNDEEAIAWAKKMSKQLVVK